MTCRLSVAVCSLIVVMMFSFAASAQTSRAAVSGAEVTGTFQKSFTGRFKGSSNEIKIAALGGGKIRLAMDLMYPYLLGDGARSANLGELDGEASISGDTAVYESTEFGRCRILIRFLRPGVIDVKQEGSDADCGFGHNVLATGTYRKVSSRKPKF